MSAAVLVAFGRESQGETSLLPRSGLETTQTVWSRRNAGAEKNGLESSSPILVVDFPHRIDFHFINVAGDRKNKFFPLPSPTPVRVFKSGKWSCHHNWKRKRSAAVNKKATKVNGAVTSKNCPFRANKEGFLIECQSGIACGKGANKNQSH